MSSVLDSVNRRTQMVGQNRLELLLFRLGSTQVYGINVFKVKEVFHCPPLTKVPQQHKCVAGMAHIRGETIAIMDMDYAIGNPKMGPEVKNPLVIITEYNMTTQGFLVHSVEKIVNLNWEEIHAPPKGTGKNHYLTAVTQIENCIVEIIDVEKILAEVNYRTTDVKKGFFSEDDKKKAGACEVLVVDDSSIARKQITKVVLAAGAKVVTMNDGKLACEYLKALADSGVNVCNKFALVISDIEMPEMDGYTLTAEIRNDPRLENLHILLHTSLSGVFNRAMVEKVGANDFLAKFNPDLLAARIKERVAGNGALL